MRTLFDFGAILCGLIAVSLSWEAPARAQSSVGQSAHVWGEQTLLQQSVYSPAEGDWFAAPGGAPPGGISCDACDGCDISCDACDGFSGDACDGCGGSSDCSAFCLLGGHEEPFDFAYDVLGLEEASCFDIGGWVQFGYHSQSNGLFNDHPSRFNNHQSWLFMEKVADGDLGLDWGFRVDALYGVDAQNTQAFGNSSGRWDFENGYDHGIYGVAIPQLYFDVAFQEVTIRIGHFYTLLGYEVVAAPNNFFYSHAFTMNNSEAFTHTGALATYTYTDDLEVYAGWTSGWDTGFDRFDDGSSFLGGATLTVTEGATVTFITTLGDFGQIGDGYSHSLVVDLELTDELNYVFQSDVLHTSDANFGPGTETDTVGINQYLIYEVSEWMSAGGRAEWWKADGVSYYGLTAGVNLKPTGNLIIRPEVRYQWSPAGNDSSGITSRQNPAGLPVGDGASFGIDAILTF